MSIKVIFYKVIVNVGYFICIAYFVSDEKHIAVMCKISTIYDIIIMSHQFDTTKKFI